MELPQYFASNGQPEYIEAPPPEVVMPGSMEPPPYAVDRPVYMEAPTDIVNMPEHNEAHPPMVVMPKYRQAPHAMMAPPQFTSPPVVVTTQPSMITVPPPPVYRDYLTWSILNLLFCCLPLGCVALIHSCKTRTAMHHQDSFAASSYSHSAFSWNVTATVVGTCINIAWIAYTIYFNLTSSYSYTYFYY